MIPESDTAKGELKRADHLIYVTLKYSRTVDVIKNILKRLISAIDMAVNDLLTRKKKKIPKIIKEKLTLLEKTYPKDNKIKDYIDFYYLLLKIDKADFKKKEEYRKNVTLITRYAEVNIPLVMEYFEKTIELVNYLNELK